MSVAIFDAPPSRNCGVGDCFVHSVQARTLFWSVCCFCCALRLGSLMSILCRLQCLSESKLQCLLCLFVSSARNFIISRSIHHCQSSMLWRYALNTITRGENTWASASANELQEKIILRYCTYDWVSYNKWELQVAKSGSSTKHKSKRTQPTSQNLISKNPCCIWRWSRKTKPSTTKQETWVAQMQQNVSTSAYLHQIR